MMDRTVLSTLWAPVTALCLLLAAAPAAAQFACPAGIQTISVGPAYLDDTDGSRALGAVGRAIWCSADYDTRPRFPRAHYVGFQGHGTVPFSSLALPQNLEGSAWLGYTIALMERAEDTMAPLDEMPRAFTFDYGVVGLGGRLQYESSADFAEQAVVGGFELRYVNPRWPLLPSTVITLSAVQPTRSKMRDALEADDVLHGRIRARGYWLAALGAWLELEVDASYFLGFGLDDAVEAAGFDEGAFGAATLGFAVDQAIGRVVLERIFFGYAYGQQPTDTEQRSAWTVGARFGGR
jgi:hypothetical protein